MSYSGEWQDRATVIILVVLLALPTVLVSLGMTGEPDANSTPVEGVSASRIARLDSDELVTALDYLEQENPLRRLGVTTDAALDLRVFGDSPNPRVALGSGAWLFLQQAVRQRCIGAAGAEAAIDQLQTIDRVIRASGRASVLAIAPDKVSLATPYLGPLRESARCAVENGRRLSAAIDPEMRSVIDLWKLEQASTDDMAKNYYLQDTHWNDTGSAVFVESIVDVLDASLARRSERVTGELTSKITDLSRLIGLDRAERSPRVGFRVPGAVVDVQQQDRAVQRTEATAEGTQLISESTFFLHDSFGGLPRRQMPPFFERLTSYRVDWEPENLALPKNLDEADLIVALIVQRRAVRGLVDGHIAPMFADALSDDLQTVERSADDPSVRSDFLRVQTDAASGTLLRLIGPDDAVIHTAKSRDGVATFQTFGQRGQMRVVMAAGNVPVDTRSWRYIILPSG